MGASFYGSASCVDATGYELYVIASAVVGGASLSGGKGSAVNAMLGALLIVLIRQSIRTLHFDQNYEWIIIGCAIIIAVVARSGERAAHARGGWRGRPAAGAAHRHRLTPTAKENRKQDDVRREMRARRGCRPPPSVGAGARRGVRHAEPRPRHAGAGAGRRKRPEDRDDREELDQPGVPLGAHRRRGGGQGAVAEARHPDRDRLADAAGRGRPGAGAAHRAGGQRGRQRGADLLLRRRQGHRRDQRRRRRAASRS